jgi:hypothetical protein
MTSERVILSIVEEHRNPIKPATLRRAAARRNISEAESRASIWQLIDQKKIAVTRDLKLKRL